MEQHYATMDDVIKALARMALKTLREKGGEENEGKNVVGNVDRGRVRGRQDSRRKSGANNEHICADTYSAGSC